jgi:alkanesulfonate monooxygenase SsuD/methylene tetrahydromethanopterin reductase-like flavin-dependent oxidoreductase (luciferase family)
LFVVPSIRHTTELQSLVTISTAVTISSPTKKPFIINTFAMQAPGHLNPGLFKYPADQGRKYNDIKNWIFIVQKLEEAKFHAIFFADVLGGYDVYKAPAKLDPTIPAWSQFPINDPLYSIRAMAAATESIVSALWEGSWRDDAVTAAAQGSNAGS